MEEETPVILDIHADSLRRRDTALRKELDRIEDFLLGPYGEDLAAVLSALRGPDNESDHLKDMTTCVIRTAAFPRLATSSMPLRGKWLFAPSGAVLKTMRLWDDDGFDANASQPYHRWGGFHFISHIKVAAKALGIKREFVD